MKNNNRIDEKWIKASIVGTIWAASEIVLGSFLHNLKVPFSGNVLTAIGIIILISISYIWTEKGLYWRAGLICAIMKTMSPSAVIFGPMIAIFSEALLLEFSVRIFGRTLFGFILGSMLAMSWNLFQKIMNYIIFYGFNIVELYKDLIKYAQKQLSIHFDIIWLPIIALLILYCILGFISAIIGIRVGRKLLRQPFEVKPLAATNTFAGNQGNTNVVFNYSITWLFADIILIVGSLVLLSNSAWYYWSVFIAAIAAIWAFRYKRALRQLSKPKFWIFFVLITMITAFVFTKVQSASNSLEQGLLIGIQMNFRAVIIILGFSVLGTELYNPRIRNYFLRTSFKQLPLALELSFESLPLMIANIPDVKVMLKNPTSVIYTVIAQAEFRLNEIKRKLVQKVFIISGSVGQGKTTCIEKIIETLKENNIKVGGFYSPRILENNITTGYDIVEIINNTREKYLRRNGDESLSTIGKFSIYPQGFAFGSETLLAAEILNSDIIVIDEIGALELEHKGWSNNLTELLNSSESHILISVRDSFTRQVIEKWNLKEYAVFYISENNHSVISDFIMKEVV